MSLIEYDDTTVLYGSWAGQMITENGFNLSLSELMQTLRVGRTFVKNHLQNNPSVRYINLLQSWARHFLVLEDSFDRVYFNRLDVMQWIMQNWTYQVRSHFIDLADFCSLEEVNRVCDNLNLQYGYKYRFNSHFSEEQLEGWIDSRILQALGITTENVEVIGRENLGFLTVEPINLFTAELHHPKEGFRSTELAYREAVRHGWVHCSYGNHKTIFAEVEHNCAYPF